MKRIRVVATLVCACLTLAVAPASSSEALKLAGYIRMRDGVELNYTVVRPSTRGRHPVLMIYSPYDAGRVPLDEVDRFTRLGFAVLGVNMRGTGCSGGQFTLLDPREATDGAAAVEWAARQSWSNGHVGMYGISYEGISQLLVAGQRPAHLDAIAPGQVLADAYRDTAYPGGILNRAFAALYPGLQTNSAANAQSDAIAGGDTACAAHMAEHTSEGPLCVECVTSRYIDSPANYPARSPDATLRRIDVPMFVTRSWQDGETSSRSSYLYESVDPDRLWTVQTNGSHSGVYQSFPMLRRLIDRFLLHFVKGVDNGWERTPHVQVLHETSAEGRPQWVTAYNSWPQPKPLRLFVSAGGVLSDEPRGPGGADSYLYPQMSPSAPATDVKDNHGDTDLGWKAPPAKSGYLAFTTPKLSRDVAILGSGNADLWIASTAPDTDLQITLTEVRPDGQEVYLQRGWLRASHRKEIPTRSTALRPLHSNREADAALLKIGEPTRVRVELWPVGHVFRAGSAIRLIIDAPTGLTGDWGLDFINTPAVNTVLHGASRRSSVVLPMVVGVARAPLTKCGAALSEPCRSSIAPVPGGSLTPSSR